MCPFTIVGPMSSCLEFSFSESDLQANIPKVDTVADRTTKTLLHFVTRIFDKLSPYTYTHVRNWNEEKDGDMYEEERMPAILEEDEQNIIKRLRK